LTVMTVEAKRDVETKGRSVGRYRRKRHGSFFQRYARRGH
jgi:hypothetical protein